MDGIEMIEKLNVTEDAKVVLRKIRGVVSSSNPLVKASIKNLFITCPYGAALSDYARAYERIIVENSVYRVVGKCTYLELAFPRRGTDKEYAEFYNSTRIVAATINEYVGVFLANIVVNAVALLGVFLISFILLRVLGRSLSLINRLPLIGLANRILGLLANGIVGYFVIQLVMFVCTMMATGQNLFSGIVVAIENSTIAVWFYHANYLIDWIMKIFA